MIARSELIYKLRPSYLIQGEKGDKVRRRRGCAPPSAILPRDVNICAREWGGHFLSLIVNTHLRALASRAQINHRSGSTHYNPANFSCGDTDCKQPRPPPVRAYVGPSSAPSEARRLASKPRMASASELLLGSSPMIWDGSPRLSGSGETLLKGTIKELDQKMQYDAVVYWIVVLQGFGM